MLNRKMSGPIITTAAALLLLVACGKQGGSFLPLFGGSTPADRAQANQPIVRFLLTDFPP